LDISEIYPKIYPKYIWDIFSDLSSIPRLGGRGDLFDVAIAFLEFPSQT
jgi:hypothetical protein